MDWCQFSAQRRREDPATASPIQSEDTVAGPEAMITSPVKASVVLHPHSLDDLSAI